MSDKWYVDVNIAVVAARSAGENKNFFTVCSNVDSLPHEHMMVDERPREFADRLFKEITGIDPSLWVMGKQSGCFVREPGTICLLYSYHLPETVPFVVDRFIWIDFAKLIEMPVSASFYAGSSRFKSLE